jgi:hypothetical protein
MADSALSAARCGLGREGDIDQVYAVNWGLDERPIRDLSVRKAGSADVLERRPAAGESAPR